MVPILTMVSVVSKPLCRAKRESGNGTRREAEKDLEQATRVYSETNPFI
jgi:hypothetical protein